VIKARNLTFQYPGSRVEAISDLDLELPKGSFGILEAQGGSGKSTFIKLLLGTLQPTSGDLEVNGVRSVQDTVKLRRRIGIVSESVDLIADRTVAENVSLPLEIVGDSSSAIKPRLLDTLHRFGLDPIKHEFPSTLSEGERRRTKLARALVTEPQLLILDEPTLGLDPATSMALWDLLFREHQRGMTILAVVSSIPVDPRFAHCLPLTLRKG
jgi:ABC-type multidrug transport system ATPase subunit